MLHLSLVHVTGADGPDQGLLASLPEREGDEHPSACFRSADGAEALLLEGVLGICMDGRAEHEDRLDLLAGNAVLAAFRPVPIVSLEASDLCQHLLQDRRLYIQMSTFNGRATQQRPRLMIKRQGRETTAACSGLYS